MLEEENSKNCDKGLHISKTLDIIKSGLEQLQMFESSVKFKTYSGGKLEYRDKQYFQLIMKPNHLNLLYYTMYYTTEEH